MATGKSGSFTIAGGNGVTLEITWSETYDIATNKSTVSITQIRGKSSAWMATYYLNGTVKIAGKTAITMNSTNGTHNVYTQTLDKYYKVSGKMGSVSDIAHNNDGTKSVSIAVSIKGYTTSGGAGSGWSATKTVEVQLTDIPRVSEPTVSASTVQMRKEVTISTNRKADSLTHTLSYSFGGATGTIATGVGDSYKWTVPDLASKISGELSGSCTITCKTYSGTTLIGTDTVSLTLTVQDKSTPTVSASTVQMGDSVTVYTNRKSSAFTHAITYAIGGATGEIGKVQTSIEWTPPKSLAAYTGNETSATCTITCKTYNGTALVGTATKTITLTVPNATVPTLSASTVAMGSNITISMPKEADVYTHDLSYAFAGATGTIETGVSADVPWTVPLSLATKIPGDTNGTITIPWKTRFKDSTTVVGTKTASFTATVPNNTTTQPDVTMTVECISDLPSKFSGIYVAGKAKAKVSYEASSDYSIIDSYSTSLLSATSGSNPYTSALLTTEGSVTITGKVTDARGYSTTKTTTIEVIPYSRPRIIPGEGQNKIVCTRCNSDGRVDAGGAYLLIKIGRKYSKVESCGAQKNFCKLSYRHKTDAAGDSAYSDPVELLAGGATADHVSAVLADIVPSNTIAYTIQLIAEDAVGESDVVTVTIPTAFVTFHSPEGGHGFTLGGYHDPTKIDVFDCFFDAEFEGDVYGKAYGLGGLPMIPEEADFNDYKDFGVYAVTQNAKAETISNMPVQKAGTLRVWSANGSGMTTGNYVYMMQEFSVYDNSATYRRFMMLENDVWEYGVWKVIDGADAIIDHGSTDGWYWRKYANGTAECWCRVSQTIDISTEWGSFFYGTPQVVTFPFAFASVPVCNISTEYQAAGNPSCFVASNGRTTTTQAANILLARPTAKTAVDCVVVYHAIGRWK